MFTKLFNDSEQEAARRKLCAELNEVFLTAFNTHFRDETKLPFYRPVNFILLPSQAIDTYYVYQYDHAAKAVTIEEYADYIEIEKGRNAIVEANNLGLMAASHCNSLIGNSSRRHGSGCLVIDPRKDNLKFNYVESGQRVSCPDDVDKRYVSYRFKFAAAELPKPRFDFGQNKFDNIKKAC